MARKPSTAPDRWEVIRIYADEIRENIRSTHKSADLARAAYLTALEGDFYALDVCFLPHGRALDFEPMYGMGNGFAFHVHEGVFIYADNFLNSLTENTECPA